jgi:hypothetical protein
MVLLIRPSAAAFYGAVNQIREKAAESIGGLALGGSTGTVQG